MIIYYVLNVQNMLLLFQSIMQVISYEHKRIRHKENDYHSNSILFSHFGGEELKGLVRKTHFAFFAISN